MNEQYKIKFKCDQKQCARDREFYVSFNSKDDAEWFVNYLPRRGENALQQVKKEMGTLKNTNILEENNYFHVRISTSTATRLSLQTTSTLLDKPSVSPADFKDVAYTKNTTNGGKTNLYFNKLNDAKTMLDFLEMHNDSYSPQNKTLRIETIYSMMQGISYKIRLTDDLFKTISNGSNAPAPKNCII